MSTGVGRAGVRDRPAAAQSHHEQRPAPALAELVTCVWIQRTSADAAPYPHRSLPNASVELVWRMGSAPQVVGPLTRPAVDLLAPGSTVVGCRLRPGAAPSVLGAPASDLVDLRLDAAELWGRRALGGRVAEPASPEEALALLQGCIAGRLADAADPDPLVAEAVRRLMPWRAGDVGSLPSTLDISERQFRRRVRSAVGISPKALHRMLRFQGFLALIQAALARGRKPSRAGLALLAAEAGYADQSHLTRECVRLTGVTPRTFVRQTEQACGAGHAHEASFAPLLRWRPGRTMR